MSEQVSSYYEQFDEWGRLDTPAGRLEYERTLSYISKTLRSKSVILDLGGGPGRYAIALAAQGHTVSLIDLSAKLVEEARLRTVEARLEDRIPLISVGNAEDLSALESNSFDSVVALGPFYHLTEPSARKRAAHEIRRVLQPEGIVFVAFIPRASGIAGLIIRAARDSAQVTAAVIERVVADGVFENPTPHGFQDGYYPHVSEMEELFTSVGFTVIDLFSIRSLYFGAEDAAARIQENSPATAVALERALNSLSRDRGLMALGGHALLVLKGPTAV